MNIRLYIIYYTMPGRKPICACVCMRVHACVWTRNEVNFFRGEMKNRIIMITIIIYPRNDIFMMSEPASQRANERALIPSMNGIGQQWVCIQMMG